MCISQSDFRRKCSTCSTMHRSVPCCRSRKGETTAMRNSSLPGLGRKVCRGFHVHRFLREIRQPEQYAQQNPKISVHDIVLVIDEGDVAHRYKQGERIPENNETQWKPGSPAQTPGHSPC